MNRIKRASLFITPLLLILMITTAWIQVLKPLAIKFIADQIPKINSAQDIAQIEVENIDLSLLKLQLIARGLKVQFKKDSLEPLLVDNVSAQLDIFDLIVGHINLSKVIIDSAQWSYAVAPNGSAKNKKLNIPVEEIFKFLEIIPIDRVIIYDSNIQLTTSNPVAQIKFQIPLLTISNNKNEIILSAAKLSAEIAENKKDGITFETDLNISFNKNELKINKIELRALDSRLSFSAKFKNIGTLLTAPEGQLKFSSKINLEDVRTMALTVARQKNRIPSVLGFVESNGDLALNSFDNIKGSIDIATTQVVLDHFKLGQAQINASINNNQIEINEVKLEHPAGKALIKNFKIEKHPPYNFSTSLEIDSFDLQKLFLSLGLNEIPAGLIGAGKINCSGTIQPEPMSNCKVEADVKNIWVKAEQKSKNFILKLKEGSLAGDFKFTKEALTYQSNIQLGKSKGTSSGRLDFKEGFNFKFATDRLNFDDVESLAGLDIKGDLKISGSTQGDSSSGVIDAKIATLNTEIGDFRLGDFKADLTYKKTQLKFSDLTGTIGTSDFTGDLNFNFSEGTLAGNIKSPNLNGDDVLQILNKKFSLPFELTGNGKAEVKLKGPIDFWKLTYELTSEFNNGSIAGENFSRLDLNLSANGENITFKKVHLKKIKSDIAVEGFINVISKEPQFNLKIKANPILLEEIDHVISYAPAIAGVGYAEGQVTGPLSFPEIFTNFTLNQVSYDKVDYPNSQGKVTIDKNYLNFSGQFFGRQIQADVIWPWNQKDSFSLKVLIHDLNPLFLLPLVSIPQPTSDFNSRLNAEIDLVSKNRNISSAEGYVKITDFILQRGVQILKLEKPSSLVFKSGLSQMDAISLKGNDSFLNIKMIQNSSNHVRLNVNADLQLRMFHFLVPFAQSLSGNLVLNSQILFKDEALELFGDGELTDGYVSLKGFPQPIENVNTPIEFSKSKIFLSDITGQLGQSDVTGIGQIDILGAKNIQVNLRAVADNIELNFPDKILTAGKASVLFTGNWLPYNLKIDYKVSHGLVEKDFDSGSNQSQTLKASSFLPPKQIEQLTPSLALDVTVDVNKGIIIKNKLIEGEATGLLNISGSPESPIITGKIDIKSGSKLIFKDKPFNIQAASINFQQTKEINPDIYISSNARISDYDINLLVQGTAKNLSIKPTSQPPLSEPDIFSLLALGVTSQTDHNLTSDTQQKQTGLEVLAAISNQSQLNKKIQEKLGLTVQLAPSIDSTKNIAVPKVVVSKKISDKLNASYSKPFTGNDQNQEIKLQYLYNSNFSVLLNYQNKDTIQQDQISNTNSNSKGILGFDLEYRDEFK